MFFKNEYDVSRNNKVYPSFFLYIIDLLVRLTATLNGISATLSDVNVALVIYG